MSQPGVPILAILGGAAIGLMWGWLLGLLVGRVHRKVLTSILVILASFAVAVEIWWFLGLPPLAWAAVAGVLSFCIHAAWRSQLRSQVYSIPPGTGGQP